MAFLSVSLTNFRNIENTKIDLLAREVYFVGENGQGKSNLLESLYISAYGSSFRTRNENEIIKNGESFYNVNSFYKSENEKLHNISVLYEKGRKKIEKNAKRISDRKDLLNTIPCVLFCHDDLEFAVGEPERRRFFIDQTLSMYDVLYIDIIRNYKKILKTRNLLLKEKKYSLLPVYDIQLVEKGLEIIKKRDAAIFKFNQIFSVLYEKITGIENVKIFYEPSWKDKSVEAVLNCLKEKIEVDSVMNTTMTGPHRDKIKFVKDGHLFVPTASTGQRRLISIILRIAQAQFYSDITQKKPVLLMDDVLLELDPDKRQKVTTLLPEYEQLFCTFLPGEPYERYKRTTTKIFYIEKGKIYE